ncbi:MAG: lipoprotein insertase outer membrane protein LolB [Gammaproteobacteria bacterium]
MTRLVLMVLLGLALTACSLAPPAVITSTDHFNHWLAEGKMGLRVADKGGNLNFVWLQEGDAYTLTLSGPLGAGRTELSGGPAGVTLRNGDTGAIRAASPEELLESVTGFRAPVSHLAHWLKARPATLEARIERDVTGRVSRIDEDGWTAVFTAWDDTHTALPRKIQITGPDTRLTVVVSRWQPEPPPATDPAPAAAP